MIIDKNTGASRGTAFVKFARPEDAEACIKAFQVRGAVLIKDRECIADRAVDKEQLRALKEDKDRKSKRPVDKRNLYLANEGLLWENNKSKNETNQR
jgi:nucleolar protein 4